MPQRLNSRAFSSFRQARTLDDLLAAEGVLVMDDLPARGRPHLYNGPPRAYLLHLTDAALYPQESVHTPVDPDAPRLARPLHHAKAPLLLAADGAVTCEAFMRPSRVPTALQRRADGTWDAHLPEVTATIGEPTLFLDQLSSHFGHVLLDSTARLWPLTVPGLAPLARMPGVGFSHRGLRSAPGDPDNARWPGFARQIYGALGFPAAQMRVVSQPTRFRSLIVPRRLSPFAPGWGFGPVWCTMMAQAGARLAAGTAAPFGPRLYLSRSRLAPDRRGLEEGQEAEVENIFAGHGFAIVHPQDHPLAMQVAALRGASHVAGLQGSQLHLAAFACDRPLSMFRLVPQFMQKDPDGIYLAAAGGRAQDFAIADLLPPGLTGNDHSYRLSDRERAALPGAVAAWLAG